MNTFSVFNFFSSKLFDLIRFTNDPIVQIEMNFAVTYSQAYFWGGYAMLLRRCDLQEGGWDRGVGRSGSIEQNSWILILIKNPLADKTSAKIILLNYFFMFGNMFFN
jgi:hypothetical protein